MKAVGPYRRRRSIRSLGLFQSLLAKAVLDFDWIGKPRVTNFVVEYRVAVDG